MANSFLLVKWFLDCITEEGETFVGYCAKLLWGSLRIHYTSALHCSNSSITEEASLKEVPFPIINDSQIRWTSLSPRIEGTWNALAPTIQRELYRAGTGTVVWSCFQPAAHADLQIGTRGHLQGKGYVERLDITIPPRELPLESLRWGRFISATDALVWIDWEGALEEPLLFRNGEEIRGCSITDSEVILDARSKLALSDSTVLREGFLASTALAMIPGIDKIAPARILRAFESKWRSKGCLQVEDSVVAAGWTIHEHVRFA